MFMCAPPIQKVVLYPIAAHKAMTHIWLSIAAPQQFLVMTRSQTRGLLASARHSIHGMTPTKAKRLKRTEAQRRDACAAGGDSDAAAVYGPAAWRPPQESSEAGEHK